jgi:hypothetical protein
MPVARPLTQAQPLSVHARFSRGKLLWGSSASADETRVCEVAGAKRKRVLRKCMVEWKMLVVGLLAVRIMCSAKKLKM